MEKLKSTGTNFIRCIKPNVKMVAHLFEVGIYTFNIQVFFKAVPHQALLWIWDDPGSWIWIYHPGSGSATVNNKELVHPGSGFFPIPDPDSMVVKKALYSGSGSATLVPRDAFKEQISGLANPDPPSLELLDLALAADFQASFHF
jgi:hypothetical protein